MKEQFVTYEIALAIKELGFDEISRFGQETSLYNVKGNHTFYCNYGFMYSGLSDEYIYAPLWQQAIDWFKDKYNFEIYILPNHHNKYKWGIITNWCKSYARNDFFDCILYSTLYEAREQAILKAVELCQKK